VSGLIYTLKSKKKPLKKLLKPKNLSKTQNLITFSRNLLVFPALVLWDWFGGKNQLSIAINHHHHHDHYLFV